MRIFHYLGDLVWKFDSWVLDRFQTLANQAYTRWDTSPYAVAAHCFQAGGMAAAVIWGVHLLDTEAWGESSITQSVMVVLGIIVLLVLALETYVADQKHRSWTRTGNGAHPSDHRLPSSRMMWVLIFLFSGGPGLVIDIITVDFSLSQIMVAFWDLAMICGFYLLSCQPPTRIENKQDIKNLVPYGAR